MPELPLLKPNRRTLTAPTFTRASVAYQQNGTSVAIDTPRFESTGIFLEKGTTNLHANPFMGGVYVAGFAPGNSAWGAPVVSENVDPAYITYGTKSQHVTGGAENNGIQFTFPGGLDVPAVYTVSVRVYVVSGTMRIGLFTSGWAGINTAVSSGVGWQNLSISWTTAGPGHELLAVCHGAAAEFYIDAIQVEKNGFMTSYDAATRADEFLSFPTANILPVTTSTVQCVLEFLVNLTAGSQAAGTNHVIFASDNPGSVNSVYIYYDPAAVKWRFFTSNAAGAWYENQVNPLAVGLHRIALVFGSYNAVYVDGVESGFSAGEPKPAAYNATAYIGSHAASKFLNGQVLEFVVSTKRGRDEMALRGVTTFLPVDKYTKYQVRFSNTMNPI